MYLLKNAFLNIRRSIGKNILIGIIIFVIALASTIALSIKEAAVTTREEGLSNLTITATISYDRMSAMSDMIGDDASDSAPSRDDMSSIFTSDSSLSLEELQTYATADSVSSFYYEATLSVNGNDDLVAIESSNDFGIDTSELEDALGDMGEDFDLSSFTSADFTLTGYSSYTAMEDFVDGVKSLSEGEYFSLDADDECIISDELATYNSLSVGDTITLVNPNNEDDTYTLTIAGIYTSTESNMGFSTSDPSNEIYVSTTVIDAWEASSMELDEDNALTASISGTYVFASEEDYEAFEEEARELGLDESYTISSSDLTSYEESLTPLNNLANYASIFLYVILAIGAIILIVFNIFRLRERKYEIGVLAAIGMNKLKIATQFLLEAFIITMIAMVIGIGIGAISSVPIANALLENISTTSTMESDLPDGATMSDMVGGSFPGASDSDTVDIPDTDIDTEMSVDSSSPFSAASQYITEISSATDLVVVLELLGIAIVLTLVSGLVSMLFIMRYDTLRILSDRE